jgi:Porin subfamily/DcaP outer membrane protein
MSGKRKLLKLAAIGGVTAMIGLAAGVSAKADELADLRANQQLLQQRIDQLAAAVSNKPEQEAAVLGGPVVAGAPSIAGSFPRSFLIPGTNTSIAISGYVKYDAVEWFHGGSPAVGSGGASIVGLAATAGAPLDLKGPPGSVTAAPAFNPAKRQYWVFHDSASEARIRLETRTPTEFGQVGTVIEMDMEGCTSTASICNNQDSATFSQLTRLRLGYATVGGFLAGQAFIPVNDLSAHPTIFDFSGDAGTFGFSRAPWIGYTWQLPYGLSFQAAAVTPATRVWTPIGGLETSCNPSTGNAISSCPPGSHGGFAVNPTMATMPDANFVLRAEQPWGHVQVGFVLERETLNDGRFIHQNFLGYGGGLSGSWKPDWFGFSSKDNFGFNSFFGTGLGHYADPSGGNISRTSNGLQTNFGLVGVACNTETGVGCYGNAAAGPTGNTLTNAALVRSSTIPEWGVEFNYQHWWLPNLRSTISFGTQTNDMNLNLLGKNTTTLTYNKFFVTDHLNLIWSPVSFIDTGFEFFYGQRLTLLDQRGYLAVGRYAFKVKF